MKSFTASTETPIRRPLGLFSYRPEMLRELFGTWKQPPFRATQVLEWVYARGVTTYDEMTNLPKSLRGRLTKELPIYESTLLSRQNSQDGTIKLLLAWPDSMTSECVLIPDGRRRTACISTQVGCPVKCVFCASGLGGLKRQLSAGEIVEQAMRVRRLAGDEDRLSNVVFMGLGEPLANYDATVRAVRAINADWGMGIGARKITISTVGLPAQMRKLADEGLQVTLALSLHAPTDELRQSLIPWSKRVSIQSLIDAADYYFERTGREVTLEYILLAGVNDSQKHAHKLSAIARQMRNNVNVIAYNPVEGLPYERPSSLTVQKFVSTLRARGVNVNVRRSRGRDIDAACGQLRRRRLHANTNATETTQA